MFKLKCGKTKLDIDFQVIIVVLTLLKLFQII